MTVIRPAIFQSQVQLECIKCGAQTGAACSCGADYRVLVEKEAERREKERKKKQKQRSRPGDNSTKDRADPIDEECSDCETQQDFWQRSLSNMAGDAVSMRAYWTRQFGDWQAFDIPTSLITLAEQAADEWKTLASILRRGKHEKVHK